MANLNSKAANHLWNKMRFEDFASIHNDKRAISIKIYSSTCMCKEHCAIEAYRILENYLSKNSPKDTELVLVQHEHGPELLFWIDQGIQLSAGIIALVSAIINARAQGIKKGDKGMDSQLEVIVRSFDGKGILREEKVLKFAPTDPVESAAIGIAIENGISKILSGK